MRSNCILLSSGCGKKKRCESQLGTKGAGAAGLPRGEKQKSRKKLEIEFGPKRTRVRLTRVSEQRGGQAV